MSNLIIDGAAIFLAILFSCVAPVWVSTAIWWFDLDWRVQSLPLRLWRAVTWFPWCIWNEIRGGTV